MNAKNATARKPTMAEQADLHDLYERAVQNVEHEVEFLQATFQDIRGRKAFRLREDFCGTASASCQWVRQGEQYQAIGVDIDASVLDWGRKNRVGRLPAADQARVQLLESDVMTVETPATDLLIAFNFSYFIFDTRDKLRDYFKRAYTALVDDGVFFIDLFGGPEAQEETKEKTKHKGFTYIWHQAEFHPVTNYIRCHIHFKFKDGSKIKKAFTYEWRLWSAPELREVLLEAGFSKATVYWEGEDEDGEGDGVFTPDEKGEADLAWIAYIVAEK
ncbi:MAG: class I SAM-dependent methyltransferase [Gammaproteobacteria bacterium]|nr:class I SAM-dependent methyltransferase [Gammaproteobacteria bacterium]MDH4313230.1 class I SAM-dependent methyltransferase [Gammaproteobacteria bacterium]MDH5213564.1 class I SAM-dependent methyltransferase [Gammaproteobacteria bacterium]MDH5499798.1 class I SAM-dependent methyltransferase [Gammaproteobacteria bacterium]